MPTKYKFLQIGLVQVAIKPLTRQELNIYRCFVLYKFPSAIVRKGRIKFIYDGSIYFNRFPNISLTLERHIRPLLYDKHDSKF